MSIHFVMQKIECVHNDFVFELTRGVRNRLSELIPGLTVQDLAQKSLDLSHSLSRYNLKSNTSEVCFSLLVSDKLQVFKSISIQ